MKYLSVCSGIEAASVAWKSLGWRPFAFSEVDAFPCAVLAHHYPEVPNLGDMTCFKEWPDADVDVLVGGTPCQSFSVAGLRKGLADPRGNLMLTYGAIARRYRPRWLVWENVPGVLSSNGGRDFGTFLGMLGELRYGFAYRVLDAQFFGVAQRRRRVFVVGCLGDWRSAAAVLFERSCLSGDTAPSREAGEGAAGTIAGGARKRGGYSTDDVPITESVITMAHGQGGAEIGYDRGPTLTCNHEAPIAAYPATAHTLRGEGFDASEDGTGRGTPLVPVAFSCKDHGADAGPLSPTLRAMGHGASHANAGGQVAVAMADPVPPLMARSSRGGAQTLSPGHQTDGHMVADAMQVRRLTPRECERLQGFPDDYTLIPWRKKPATECPDGPRYKALGNSMAVPVMTWIGRRMLSVSEIRRAA